MHNAWPLTGPTATDAVMICSDHRSYCIKEQIQEDNSLALPFLRRSNCCMSVFQNRKPVIYDLQQVNMLTCLYSNGRHACAAAVVRL